MSKRSNSVSNPNANNFRAAQRDFSIQTDNGVAVLWRVRVRFFFWRFSSNYARRVRVKRKIALTSHSRRCRSIRVTDSENKLECITRHARENKIVLYARRSVL